MDNPQVPQLLPSTEAGNCHQVNPSQTHNTGGAGGPYQGQSDSSAAWQHRQTHIYILSIYIYMYTVCIYIYTYIICQHLISFILGGCRNYSLMSLWTGSYEWSIIIFCIRQLQEVGYFPLWLETTFPYGVNFGTWIQWPFQQPFL